MGHVDGEETCLQSFGGGTWKKGSKSKTWISTRGKLKSTFERAVKA